MRFNKSYVGNKKPNISICKVYIVHTSTTIQGLFTNLKAVYDFIKSEWSSDYKKSYSSFVRDYYAGKTDGYTSLDVQEQYLFKRYDKRTFKRLDEAAWEKIKSE